MGAPGASAQSLFAESGGQSVDTNNSVFNSSFAPSASQLDTNEVDPVAEHAPRRARGRSPALVVHLRPPPSRMVPALRWSGSPDDASDVRDEKLTVGGKREGTGKSEDAFLHRGIAARGFVRSFVLADGMVVDGATLEHGLLHIDVTRPEPEKRVVAIPIRTGG